MSEYRIVKTTTVSTSVNEKGQVVKTETITIEGDPESVKAYESMSSFFEREAKKT